MILQSAKNVISSLFLFAFLLIGCFHSLNGQNCLTPTNASVNGITPVAATVNWDAMPNATAYEVNYRPMNAPSTLPWTSLPTNTNSLSITGLTPSTMYSAQIRSVCGPDFSNYTVNVDFSTQSCVPPGGLSAVNLTANTADLQWNVAQGASAYQLLYRVAVTNPGVWNTIPVSGTSYQLTGLAANTLYAARLLSDCGGNLSDTSKVIYFSTNPCSVPSHLIITAQTASSISLTWDAVPNATQYNVQYRPAESNTWTTVNANTNSKTINGLTGNSLYEFRVRSRCSQNEYSAYTLPVNGFTLPCAMPENAVISNVTVNSVTINWNNATGSTQYRVEYKKEVDPNWTTVNANNTSKTINNLDLDTEYQVRVRSKCTGNQYSAYTDTLEFRTKSCAVPQGLEAVNISFTSARIQWNSVQNATRYQLQYRLLGDTSWTTVNPDSNIRVVNGLTPDSQYEVRVRTRCANNVYSDYSGLVVFSTSSCGMPQGLQITEVSYTSVKFSWNGVNNAPHYQAEYRIIGDTVWRRVSTDSTYRYLNNLVPNTQYEARVRSRCANNVFSGWNESIFFETPGCSAPRNIMGGYRSNTSIELIWDGSPSAQLYQIGYRLVGDTVWTHQVNSDSNRKTLNNLTLGNVYEVRVRSKCANGVFSDWVSTSVIHMESCSTPTNLQVVQIDSLRYRASWNRAGDSLVYVFSYLSDDLLNRVNVYTQDTFLIITHWNPCTQYDYWLYTACSPEQKSRFLSGTYQTIYVLPCANHAPIGVNDHIATWYDQPITYTVFDNDTDAEGDSLYFDPFNPPYLLNSPGQIIVNGREITYLPDTNNYQNYALIIYTPYDGRKRGEKTYYYLEVNKTTEEDNVCNCNLVRNGNFEKGIPDEGFELRGQATYYTNYTWSALDNILTPDIVSKTESYDFFSLPVEYYSKQKVNVNGVKALRLGWGEAAKISVPITGTGRYTLTFKTWSGALVEKLTGQPLRISLRKKDQFFNKNYELKDSDLLNAGCFIIYPSNNIVQYSSSEELVSLAITFNINSDFFLPGEIYYLCFEKLYNDVPSSIVIDDVCLIKLDENDCPSFSDIEISKKFINFFERNGKSYATFELSLKNNGKSRNSSITIIDEFGEGLYYNAINQSFSNEITANLISSNILELQVNELVDTEKIKLVFELSPEKCIYINKAKISMIDDKDAYLKDYNLENNFTSNIKTPEKPSKNNHKIIFTSNLNIVCSGETVIFTVNGVVGEYTIVLPDGNRLKKQAISFSYIVNYTSTFKIIGINDNGCTDETSITIEVIDIQPAYAPLQTICTSGGIFNGPPKIEGSIITNPSPLQINYSWQPATYLSSTKVANPIFQNLPNIPTTVTYTLTAWAGACTTSTQVTVNFVPPPIITVQNLTLCAGQSGLLSASSPTGVLYSWSPITGLNNPNIPNPTVILQNTGTYTYTVTVQGNPFSCSSTANVTVTVLPSPTITIHGPDKLCLDSDDEIALTSVPPAEYYTVNTPTGSFNLSPDQPYFRITPTQTTTYTITGYIGNCSDTKTKTVIVPDVAISYPSFTICPNQPTTLTPTFVGQDVRYYSWSPKNGLNDAYIQNPIFTPSGSGTYNFIVTVSTLEEHDFYCTTTANVTVVVKEGSTVSITGAPSQAICPGQNVTLTATGNPEGGTYTWSHDLGTGTNRIVNVTPNQTTIYTVTYEQNGCTSTVTATVTVTSLDFQLNVPVVCVGQESVIISLVPPPDNTYTVTWALNPSFPLIDEGNPSERRFFAFQEGTYTVTATISKGGCSVTKVRMFNVGTPPPLLVSPSVTVACGGSRTLTATGATNYQWIAPPFQIIGTQSQVTVNPQTTTTYTVIGSNASGCTTSATVKVTVINEIDFTEDPQNVCERYTRRTFCVTNPDLEATYSWRFIENNPNLFFFNGQSTGTCITVITTDVTIPINLGVTNGSSSCEFTQNFPAPFLPGRFVLSEHNIRSASELIQQFNTYNITPQILQPGGAGTIVIDGEFDVDVPELSFSNLNIVVRNITSQPGKIILSRRGDENHLINNLHFNQCYLHTELETFPRNSVNVIGTQGIESWKGIWTDDLLFQRSDNRLYIQNSQIEHAEIAVYYNFQNISGTQSSIAIDARNSCFNQNAIHLAPSGSWDNTPDNPNTSVFGNAFSGYILSGNRFDCNAPLPNTSNEFTRIGIYLRGGGIIGSPTLNGTWSPETRNTFTRMSVGILFGNNPLSENEGNILLGNSHLNNNDFFDLINSPSYPIQATAMYITGAVQYYAKVNIGNHSPNNIFRHSNIPDDATARGVWINHLSGNVLIQGNNFENIETGTYLSDLDRLGTNPTTVEIKENYFKKLNRAGVLHQNIDIFFDDSQDRFGDVGIFFKSNTLEDVKENGWFSSIFPALGPNIIVEGNTFTRTNLIPQIGSDIMSTRFSSASFDNYLTINDNIIDNRGNSNLPARNGITVMNNHGSGTSISGNTIRNVTGGVLEVSGEGGQPGINIPNSSAISVTNAHRIQINSNILVNPDPNLRATGIRLTASPNSTVSCNRIGEYNFGIIGEGGSAFSTLTSNVLRFDASNYTDASALTLYNNGNLGTQGSPDDGSNYNMLSWCAPSTPNCYGALSVNSNPQGIGMDVYVRQYNTNDGNGRSYSDDNYTFGQPLTNANIGQNTTPLTIIPVNTGQPTNRCDASNDQGWLTFVNTTHPSQLESFATGNYHLALFENEGKYMYRQYVYDSIVKNATLRLQSILLDSFYLAVKDQNLGRLHRIQELMRQGENVQAENLNEAIVPQNKVEQNHKEVNSVYFEWIRQYSTLYVAQNSPISSSTVGGLNPLEKIERDLRQSDSLKTSLYNQYYSLISQIAEQCPLKGGKAVYQARALRMHIDGQFRQYIDDCREFPLPKMEQSKANNAGVEISMYPNPAKETVSLNYVFPKDINAIVDLFTSSGSLVLTTQLYSGKGVKELSLNTLSDGIYLVSFRLSNGDLITKKLTIQR